MGQGYKSYIGLAEEPVAWGTKVVTGMDFCEFTSEGIKKTVEPILSKASNSGRTHKKRMQGVATVAGPFNFEVNPDDVIGLALKHVLWSVDVPVQQGATAAWLHEWTPGATMPKGLTAQVGRDDSVFDCFGGKINTLKFKAAVKEILQAEVGMVFKDEEVGVAQTPTYSNQNPFVFHQGVLTIGGTATDVSNFDLEISNALKIDRRSLGTALILEPKEGKISVKGSFKQFFAGAGAGTAYAKFIAGTPAALVLTFTGALIATPYSYKFTIALPQVYYDGETPNVSGPDSEIEQNVPFTAIDDGTFLIKVGLINTRTTAY